MTRRTAHRLSDLRIARLAAGHTLSSLSDETGFSRSFLCRAETGGYARITTDRAEVIAKALGTTVDRLFGEEGEER